jgi:FG-GAP-like repeat/RTX calcium-binding nonapeptide repeat (4 copies)
MAFDFSTVNFLPNKRGEEFNFLQQIDIRTYMELAYLNSALAKKMFDDWGKPINVEFNNERVFAGDTGKSKGLAGTGRLVIDLTVLDDLTYINDRGKAASSSPLGGIVHEVVHALKGISDNISPIDYQGDTVRFTNQIWAQMQEGLPFGVPKFNNLDKQISYTASAYSTLQKGGYEYTDGAQIDAAYNVEYERAVETSPGSGVSINALFNKGTGLTEDDFSSAPLRNSRDLLIGGSSPNKLFSGAGNDFLFGGGGNDTLNGGTGIDTAVYYGPSRDYKIDPIKNSAGSLTGWTVQNTGTDGAGTDRLINIEKIQFDGDFLNIGHKTLTLNNNGLVSQKYNDFNGDGNSDILWRNIDGGLAIWSLDGNAATPQFVDSVTLDWTTAGTGDFNGDLTEDILWRNDNGTVALWTMNDSIVTSSSVLGTVGIDWKIVGTGDFNGDSESDILWRNDDGRVALWQMNDSIVTTSRVLDTVSLDWTIVETGDFNSDGESDILWRNDNGDIALWQINDSAYTTGAVIGTVTSDWKIAGSSDFNGDGSSDILWRNNNGTVALWQINDLAYTSGTVIATETNDWTIAETGDFNGDGKSDILWRNDNGSVATWQMDGSYVVSRSLTSIPSADLAWNIAAPILYT